MQSARRDASETLGTTDTRKHFGQRQGQPSSPVQKSVQTMPFPRAKDAHLEKYRELARILRSDPDMYVKQACEGSKIEFMSNQYAFSFFAILVMKWAGSCHLIS